MISTDCAEGVFPHIDDPSASIENMAASAFSKELPAGISIPGNLITHLIFICFLSLVGVIIAILWISQHL